VLSALLIPAFCVGGDLAIRGPRAWRAGAVTYAAGVLLSVLVWGIVLEAARHPRRAVRRTAVAFLAGAAGLGIGLQAVVYSLTHAYLGRRALILALGIPHLGHAGYVTHNALRAALVLGIPAVLVAGFAAARTRWLGLRGSRAWSLPIAAVAAVIVTVLAPFGATGVQPLPPDVLWINGVGGPLLYFVGLAHKPKALPVGKHEALPSSRGLPADAPPIVLILGESVRRDAVCGALAATCDRSPRVDAVAPDRIGYRRAFSVASCTELATSSLWTGMAVTTDPDALARAPLVWDWARARGYRTAYLTSQNLLFQQSDQFLHGSRIDLLHEARDEIVDAPIDGGSPDESTTPAALAFVEAPGAPAFVVVHYANTHVPYRQVPGFARYPTDDGLGRYRNSLAFNDDVIAGLLAGLRRGARGRRAIVLYTSDHGEAFQDHGASYHSFDLYAEQVDVPLWIDAPPGVLPDDILARLRRDAPTRPVATFDLTATMIDLMGGLDVPELRSSATALSGRSLLRDAPGLREVFLWNCPPTRECATESFGVVSFPMKLHYVGHDESYACHDIEADPTEELPRPATECAPLRALLDRTFGARGERTAGER
jgi:hypothetical protein